VTGPGFRPVLDDASTRVVWLRISIDEAMRRAEAEGVDRPLLAGDDPKEQATRLLAEREPLYAAADHVIDVDGRTADSVVDDILAWLKTNIS
jgi:shikimate kinase